MSRCKPSIGAATINAFVSGLTLAQLSNKSANGNSADKHNPFMRLLSPYRYLASTSGRYLSQSFFYPSAFFLARSIALSENFTIGVRAGPGFT